MRTHFAIAAIVFGLVAGPSMAQQPPANQNAPSNNAVSTPSTPAPAGAPAAGANSFTEGQARSRLESNGFTNVSGLQKDNSGVWRGKASKGGRTLDVAVDYQGNIVER